MAKNGNTGQEDPKRPRVITIDLEKVQGDAVGDAIGEMVATTVGDSVRPTIAAVRTKRDNVVMVRVSRESLAKLDELVDCGLTNSRSEAAAFLIAEGVKACKDLYAKIAEQSQVIRQAKLRLREMLDDEVIAGPADE